MGFWNSVLSRFGLTRVNNQIRYDPVGGVAVSDVDYHPSTKHDFYADYGWKNALSFEDFYRVYRRNDIARGAIKLLRSKTYQDYPTLIENNDVEDTPQEVAIQEQFEDIHFWPLFADTDERAMVGGYAFLLLRIGDGRPFDQPVSSLSSFGGIKAIVEVIPVWRDQLSIQAYNNDLSSVDYGKASMYRFDEQGLDAEGGSTLPRSFNVHPDRLLIVSENRTMESRSLLEAPFNTASDTDKTTGAGAEGFWRNSKAAPILGADPNMDAEDLKAEYNVQSNTDLVKHLKKEFARYYSSIDSTFFFAGGKPYWHNIQLGDPQYYYFNLLSRFATGIGIPVKILMGSESGERSSSLDAKNFANRITSRRNDVVSPILREFIKKLKRWGCISDVRWQVRWKDITVQTELEMAQEARLMGQVNEKHPSYEMVFSRNEIRAARGLPPIDDKTENIAEFEIKPGKSGVSDDGGDDNFDRDQDREQNLTDE